MADYLIAIDPGHGADTYENTGGKGVAPGGNIFEEHSFNASVARKLKRKLDAAGFRTFFTQTPGANDAGLRARTKEANAKGADLLVSIHANAGVKAADGACAFYWYTSEGGRKLAKIWADFARELMAEVGLHGDGIHECVPGTWTNFHMVRETKMIAMLIEHGFMTNESDLSYLRTAAYREDCAETAYRSICEYYGVKHGEGETKKVADREEKVKGVTVTKSPDYIERGDRGAEVVRLQRELKALGHYDGNIDGIFGPITESAVESFQRAENIGVDGVVGPVTRKHLRNADAKEAWYIGKRVESKHRGKLRFYARPSWADRDVAGHLRYGYGFPDILAKVDVDGYPQYKVRNSAGDVYYVTASKKYVRIEN